MKKERHPVDDFFKEALHEHQVKPSDAGRQRFLEEAATIEINGNRSRSRWLLLFGSLFVATLVALIFWFYDGEQSAVSNQQATIGNQQYSPPPPPATPSSITPGSALPNATLPNSETETLINDGVTIEVPGTLDISESVNTPGTTALLISESIFQTEADPVEESQINSSADFPAEDTIVVPEPTIITGKIKKRKRVSDWQFATSVYYSPEWMFNTLEGDKFVSNFGFEESFRYGRYVLRTGIGLSIAKGTNELMVEYNDYLGSFNELDSIGFNWDEKNYHLLPTYYTSTKNVWDSLLQLDYPKVVKRYTYLQIPLVLGYDVLQKKRISLGFRAGPILSLLIHSKQLSGEYDPGKNQIIRINQVTPDRVQTNWQLMGGINVSLPISKRIGFEIEPNIKYYFNSVYEKSDASKKPWSVGFRASFSIRY